MEQNNDITAEESARLDWEDARRTAPVIDYRSMPTLELCRAFIGAENGMEGADMPEFAHAQMALTDAVAEMGRRDAELIMLRLREVEMKMLIEGIYKQAYTYLRAMAPRMPQEYAVEYIKSLADAARAIDREPDLEWNDGLVVKHTP